MPVLTGSHSITSLSPALAKQILKKKIVIMGGKLIQILQCKPPVCFPGFPFHRYSTIPWPLRFEGLGSGKSNSIKVTWIQAHRAPIMLTKGSKLI